VASLGLRQPNHTRVHGGSYHARGPKPPPIVLRPTQRVLLRQLARRQTGAQRLVRRARIILEAASGANNEQIAKLLGIDRATVRTWRIRWLEALPRLNAAENVGDDDERALLAGLIEEVLVDEPRSGKPATFSPEQICQIVALACEDPRDCGRPVTHWSTKELADEVVKQGIVGSISARSVGRFLGRSPSQTASGALLEEQ
jgi:putative transposase